MSVTATEISKTIEVLRKDLDEKKLSQTQRLRHLEGLKAHSRDVKEGSPLLTKEGIQILCKTGLDGDTASGSQEALKALANVMVLHESTRQIFADLGYASKTVELLQHDDRTDQFLGTRILFLCTYETKLDFKKLFESTGLVENLDRMLSWHAENDSKSDSAASPFDAMGLSEALKLIYNLTHYYPDQVPAFTKTLSHILKILTKTPIPSPPLQSPLINVINCISNLDIRQQDPSHSTTDLLFPSASPKSHITKLTTILDLAIRQYPDEELEKLAVPLINLIGMISELAPEEVRTYLQTTFLPSISDRDKPLGATDSLSSCLLRLTSSAVAPMLRESIMDLFFELSNKDVSSFIRNIGYGYASGYLAAHNLTISRDALESLGAAVGERADDPDNGEGTSVPRAPQRQNDSESGERRTVRHEVNPITGQRLDRETADTGPPMTEDEKLREAERLHVLIQRLNATGVMSVENPMAQALREGRFEELSDDDSESDS